MATSEYLEKSRGQFDEVIEECVKIFIDFKKIINNETEGDENIMLFEKLKDSLKTFCTTEYNMRCSYDILGKINLESNNEEYNITEIYQNMLEKNVNNNNPTENPIWKELIEGEKQIETIEKSRKTKSMEYQEVGDNSLMCANVFKPPIDPFVKCVIKNPYINTKCGHVYNKDSIFNYIESAGKKAKCPYIGCVEGLLKREHIVEDKKLKLKIIEYFQNCSSSSDEDYDD